MSRSAMTRLEYDRLVQLGTFDDERVELLEGMLVAESPQGPPHAFVITELNRLLARALRGDAAFVVRPQLPLAVSDESEPEPDFAIVAAGDYSREHPATALLVIEVSESSLPKDRQIKARLYAKASIAEYWIVDLAGRAVEIHRDPRPEGYSRVSRHGESETVRADSVAAIEIALRDILPPR